ncbi:MAG: DUF4860 domain-containing protein [Lachnospiraceae bacterium]|nr:DUF4860 domain-containing protein [Lachnospiraceae bacterium]
MLNTKKKTGPIEFVFPILLFLIFTLSALFIILFAAQIYQKIVDDSSINYSANTALSYVSEKIRQGENGDGIEVGSFEDCDALILHNHVKEVDYATYIYFYDGALYEFMAESDRVSEMTVGTGTAILEVADFTITEDDNHLISFTCTDESGNKSEAMIAISTE